MSKSTELKLYSPREVGVALNNALLAASRPESGEVRPFMLRRLSDYAAALISPCSEHVESGLLTSAELVTVFCSCALLVHARDNTTGVKLPMASLAKEVKCE